ncbi:unnamed protein product [Heligmosomoides polygyrus]|uniref:DUF4338 domain-containing protein n=1 Tax=Heligmosomoides polygyrus TaxID=6339 RepID=A0A183FEC6_HELPZ|nr:unnamed protein product [Heligmosomoides polygyrus]
MTLSSVSEAGFLLPEHPPRGKCDPYNMATLSGYATQYAEVHPWTSTSWMELRKRKNLIILPAGFDNVLRSLKTENQRAVVLKKPVDIQPDWFIDNLSSSVLFRPAEFAGTLRWRGAWTLLLQQVARGVELITLAGTQNHQEWRKSVDMLGTYARRRYLNDRHCKVGSDAFCLFDPNWKQSELDFDRPRMNMARCLPKALQSGFGRRRHSNQRS